MNTIEWLRNFMMNCPALKNAAGVAVNELSEQVDFFSIDPLPGGGVIEEELDGTRTIDFPFTVSSCQCSADEANRLESNGTFEALRDWMEMVTDHDEFPEMGSDRYAEKIQADGWAYLFQREDDPTTAIYQISGRLTYVKEPH